MTELQMTDQSIQRIRERIVQQPAVPNPRYQLIDNTVFYRGGRSENEWKPVLPACLEERVLQYTHTHTHTHTSLGHLAVEKCMQQIKQAYHLKNLGHKVRKFISCCDTCQRVKFPNRNTTTEERSHLPIKPGSLCVIDLFGSLPTSRGGVKYILVCYYVFFETRKTLPAEGCNYEGVSEQANKPLFPTCRKTRSDPL